MELTITKAAQDGAKVITPQMQTTPFLPSALPRMWLKNGVAEKPFLDIYVRHGIWRAFCLSSSSHRMMCDALNKVWVWFNPTKKATVNSGFFVETDMVNAHQSHLERQFT
ncbi:hypothetical protein J3L11_18700 [Shewanella sp. 4t3-1-2LB]|uniref:hypothetical protein n=1 Tax=Shewanella sp. 4t3-1-2LB TaxID=2817682 RepID=UPI001A9A2B78|nr:hypothetical protein [Shewanella sp. 4t3-1-2LB]MBO1273662.1 hypothetical protein [Shewanella sp. 4t3-1-2LB]